MMHFDSCKLKYFREMLKQNFEMVEQSLPVQEK